MKKTLAPLVLALLLAAWPAPAAASPPADVAALRAVAPERSFAGGSLRLINIYRAQGLVLAETAGRPPGEVVDRLVKEVYTPHQEFWRGYLGDEADFRAWAAGALLDPVHPIHLRLGAVLALDLDALFEGAVARVVALTGRRPAGVWYVLFGPGWTDMGGLGEGRMLIDLSKQEPSAAKVAAVLPHELNHQIYDQRPDDPAAGTVLARLLDEGFASYVAWLASNGRSPAESLFYGEEEWAWSLAHEAELFAAAEALFGSTARKDVDAIASRTRRLLEGGPAAAGYFIGFRIVQAYVAARGEGSWKEIYDLPVREVLARSGYVPGRPGRIDRWSRKRFSRNAGVVSPDAVRGSP